MKLKNKVGQVFVIDVATISSYEEQVFVVVDAMKGFDECILQDTITLNMIIAEAIIPNI